MGQEHPDERYMLTGEERSQFRQIWKELADEETGSLDTGDGGTTHRGWSIMLMACVLLVFLGLAVSSTLLVAAAAGGAVGARIARRR